MTVIHEEMTPEEKDIADHFERSLSDSELRAATVRFGAGAIELLPPQLSQLLHERAVKDGQSQLDVMRKALESYLIPA